MTSAKKVDFFHQMGRKSCAKPPFLAILRPERQTRELISNTAIYWLMQVREWLTRKMFTGREWLEQSSPSEESMLLVPTSV